MLSTRRLLALAGVTLLAAGAVAVGNIVRLGRPEAVRADNAAGDTACLSCHGDKASFEQTAHRLTSQLPAPGVMMGSFAPGQNVLRTANPALHFRMDSTATGFYETAVAGRGRDTTMHTERIDFVTGSRKGQSFLYWRGDDLFQLPVSYWTGVGWVNSPGYPDGSAYWDRPISPRCLECHASGFQSVTSPGVPVGNRYRRTGILLGITCETCHGAGQRHVRRERSLLHALLPPAIVNPARLARARQLDGCALCHSGVAAFRTPAFSHVPGQPLGRRADWLTPPDTGAIDVHGNQVALLERSRCFRASQMTCATCHDVHRQQRDVAELSGRCLGCHTPHGRDLAGRCVDCHMPALTSTTILSRSLGRDVRVQVRTHWIKVYPE